MNMEDDESRVKFLGVLQKCQLLPETLATFGGSILGGTAAMPATIRFPIHDVSGRLVAYSTWSSDRDAYQYSDAFAQQQLLFNSERAVAATLSKRPFERVVIVIEDILSCIKVHQAGYPFVVALLGSTMSEAQEADLLGRFTHVWLMLDGDDEGWAGTQALVARLATEFFVKAAVLPSKKKPAELPTEAIQAILAAL